MPIYYKKVEAVQIVLTEDHKSTLAKKQPVEDNGVQLKKAGDEYFALVRIAGSIERAEIGDYLIVKGGKVKGIVSKNVFEQEYMPEEKETPVVELKPIKKGRKKTETDPDAEAQPLAEPEGNPLEGGISE